MLRKLSPNGFSVVEVLIIILVIAILGFGSWYVWQKSKHDISSESGAKSSQNGQDKQVQKEPAQDETAHWTPVTTQDGVFSMRVPDGWKLGSYPGDFLGAIDVAYKAGTPATIDTEKNEYVGHSLRFRASITDLDDAKLGPQWESPQPGLEESTRVFTFGTLQGKRFQGIFTGDLNQTLYEYVFDLGNNKKLDIVYTVYHSGNEKDDVGIVEKAIKTIKLNK